MKNHEIASRLLEFNAKLDRMALKAETDDARNALVYLSNALDHMVFDLSEEVAVTHQPEAPHETRLS